MLLFEVRNLGLNIRESADASSREVAELPPGTTFSILEEVTGGSYTSGGSTHNNWYKIKLDGREAFAAVAFVELVTDDNRMIIPPSFNTADNIDRLGRILMSEASIGNSTERRCVGWTVLNRLFRNDTNRVRDVERAYATNQRPTEDMKDLAAQLLAGDILDLTNGCTHFYSPRSMPKEGESQVGDTRGGLESVPPLTVRNYKPSWSVTFAQERFPGVRLHYYKFHRAPGTGRVT